MKKKMSLLVALVMAVAITGYSVSGTYAKYTSEFAGTDSARVAQWAFDINGEEADFEEKTFTFDLFKTVGDSDAWNISGEYDQDEDVMVGEGENIIAPGTSGRFEIVVTNNSEVNATVESKYVVNNPSNIPVEFSTDGVNWYSDVNLAMDTVNPKVNMNGGEETITVYWIWNFNGTATDNYVQTDESDTDLGIDGTAEISVDVTLIATQID